MLTELSVGRGARPGSRCFASVADRRVKGRTETAHQNPLRPKRGEEFARWRELLPLDPPFGGCRYSGFPVQRQACNSSETKGSGMHEVMDFQLTKQRQEELLHEVERSRLARTVRAARKRRIGRVLVWELKRGAGRLPQAVEDLEGCRIG
jgi:hypothetical protein